MDKFNKYLIIFAITLIISITIGYAFLNASLNINGSSKIYNATWNVHFENVQVTSGSVAASTPTIDSSRTTVTYSVHLSKPGDFYEFTVDAKNDGTIDAMIDTILSTLNNTEIQTLPSYLNYSVSYNNGMPIQSKHELLSGSKETYKVRVEYRTDITANDLPSTNQTLNMSFTVTYVQKDNTSIAVPHPISFTDDSWDTIISVVRSGYASNCYNLGDTKEIDLGSLGTHTLRIANMSTPNECNQEGFSQTACGFVLEFTDIIMLRFMNSSSSNFGSWPSSSLRSFIRSNIYNVMPSNLQSIIIDTTVVSGYGVSSSSNYTSTDKLYLLSSHEVIIDTDGNSNAGINYYDSSYNNTRQLDYYNSIGVTTSNYINARKAYNGSYYNWWLRSPLSSTGSAFYIINVAGSGNMGGSYADNNYGVSPAFRIG